jgi:hypothetical protein
MARVAASEELRRTLAARGRERARLFSPERTAREMLPVYRAAAGVAERAGPQPASRLPA